MTEAKTVFIVEDDFLVSEYLQSLCKGFGATVVGAASSGEEALSGIRKHRPDYILMDVRINGDVDGVQVAESVYRELPDTRVIFITASAEPSTLERIWNGKPFQVLTKPFKPDDLRFSLTV
jgi:two-component system, response regulator PdtaR